MEEDKLKISRNLVDFKTNDEKEMKCKNYSSLMEINQIQNEFFVCVGMIKTQRFTNQQTNKTHAYFKQVQR